MESFADTPDGNYTPFRRLKSIRVKAPMRLERRLQTTEAADRRFFRDTGAWWFIRPVSDAEREFDVLTTPPASPANGANFLLVVDSPSREVTARIPLSHPREVTRFVRLLTISARGVGTIRVSTDEEFEALIQSGGL